MSNFRKLTMEDLIEKVKDKELATNSKECNYVPKNQKDFGHKKRIKP